MSWLKNFVLLDRLCCDSANVASQLYVMVFFLLSCRVARLRVSQVASCEVEVASCEVEVASCEVRGCEVTPLQSWTHTDSLHPCTPLQSWTHTDSLHPCTPLQSWIHTDSLHPCTPLQSWIHTYSLHPCTPLQSWIHTYSSHPAEHWCISASQNFKMPLGGVSLFGWKVFCTPETSEDEATVPYQTS